MDIRNVSIIQVRPWMENPRDITTEDFKRLKAQIEELGVYKPLVVYEDTPGSYVVLGGNMRLRALQELKFTTVDVSVVTVTSEADKLKYNFSDNDGAGRYNREKVAELTFKVADEIDADLFKLDLSPATPLANIIDEVGPSGGGEGGEESSGIIVDIVLAVPAEHEDELLHWLTDGDDKSPEALGNGALKRAGIT